MRYSGALSWLQGILVSWILPNQEIDDRIGSKIIGTIRFYDSITHHALFNLPKYLRTDIKKQTRIISDKDPLTEHYPGISTDK